MGIYLDSNWPNIVKLKWYKGDYNPYKKSKLQSTTTVYVNLTR